MRNAQASLTQWLEYLQTLHPVSIDLGLERVKAVAAKLDIILPRYNILIAGKSDNSSDDDMVIWKFESSGVIDTSFASGVGYMTIDGTAGGGDDEALGISFDEVGNILVSGRSFNGSDHDAVIWRIK